jgi:outer membrane protein assembly factor BamB
MRALAVLAAAIGLVAFAGPGAMGAPAADVNWPQFRFDQAHTGLNPLETTINRQNVSTLQLDWQAQLGAIVDFSSASVVDGVVYIASSDGRLWAYPADGCGSSFCATPLWSTTSLAQIIDSPTVVNGVVYVGSQTSPTSNDGKLNAFSAAGCGSSVCSPLWQGLAGTQSILESSPAVSHGFVYVGSFDHRLYVFDANGCGQATCQPLWTGTTGGSIESTPTVAGRTVFVGSDDGKLYAFPADGCGQSTCSATWTGSIGTPVFFGSPAVSKGLVYLAGQHDLAAFTAAGCGTATCQPVWKDHDLNGFFNGSAAIGGGRVYIGFENGLNVYAAAGCGQATCKPLWTDFGSGTQAAVISSPALANGVVYVGRNTGQVLAWRAGPCGTPVCSEIWSASPQNIDQLVTSSPTVVNGKVYIGSADVIFPEDTQGRLYVFALP